MDQQLTLDMGEKLNFDFDNYNWLKGNSDNLRIFFRKKLTEDISQKLKDDALRRLKILEMA
ncbi:MAG: hypothetical protein ACYDIA_13810 [Candidatus Humimicrobiaceae bacterium]